MASAESDAQRSESSPSDRAAHDETEGAGGERLHRIQTVRFQQGMSLRTAARQLGLNVRETRRQEHEATDLHLTQLYRWQTVLNVPISDLLVDPGTPLSRPVMERASLVRVMKTAAALLEAATTPRERRLAQNLVVQLIELMPELEGVGPWHSVGQRRSLEEYGRIVERCVPEDLVRSAPVDNWD